MTTSRLLLSRLRLPALLVGALLAVSSCRTCPMQSCHTRKVHMHNGTKFRGQPLWKKQNPAIGEKIKVYKPDDVKRNNDRRRTINDRAN
ncbi:hypothetical protein [Hymenobacter psychrophilus]|uniref:Secreted protein n=1 Tax=Hymenobacter psychrophilus TaxID=651662 RepID=A0A1H3NAX9_9BACT|nr:hypothetical protein [Hymenobacter psychrophilus]SDY86101.1 hypothetical protein SAMN04488069_11622 [Hymenobacter psychrophilus]